MKIFFCIALLCMSQHIFASKIIYEQQSNYSNIAVREKDGIRCLEFDSSKIGQKFYQGCIHLKNHALLFNYTKVAMASLFLKPDPQRILVIGLGAGVIPRSLYLLHPQAHFDLVELDEAVVDIAQTFFSFPKADNINITIGDGRVFVNDAIKKGSQYDIVIIDAFDGEYIPEHLMTFEFLDAVKSVLTDDGVVVANTFSQSALYDHESVTYAKVFGDFYNVVLKRPDKGRVILATQKDQFLPIKTVQKNAASYYVVFKKMFDIEINSILPNMEMTPDWDTSARVLTDQYSPANALKNGQRVHFTIAKRLDKIIRDSPIWSVVALLAMAFALFFIILSLGRLFHTLRHRVV